ncbi:MAG: LysM domain-containing protein [Planctomycetota bacterium]
MLGTPIRLARLATITLVILSVTAITGCVVPLRVHSSAARPATGVESPPSQPNLPVYRDARFGGSLPIHSESSAIHVVRPGDTLYSIARAHSVPVDELMRLNARIDPRRLLVGTSLVVPGGKPAFRKIQRWRR